MNFLMKKIQKKLGILGDGQLAQMLVEAALKIGVKPLLFASHDQAPAALLGCEKVIGKLSDRDTLREFLTQVEVVAFENEFLDTELLKKASEGLHLKFLPPLEVLEQLQDKLNQKRIFEKIKIPTAPWTPLYKHSQEEIQGVFQKYPAGFVLKWSRMGYDGKGILMVHDLNVESLSKIQDFIREALQRGAQVYAEEKIDFVQELALVSLRSQSGEMLHYPLVHSEQVSGICKKVWGPSIYFGIPDSIEKAAQAYAEKMAKALGIVGVFALEMFYTKKSELLVNEAAPRVHNSGHYTQDACKQSQFENHVRALLDMPLGGIESKQCFAMLNLLGLEGHYNSPSYEVKEEETLFLHWYGKKEIRPLRKVGHLNTVFSNPQSLGEQWKKMENFERVWFQKIKK